MLLVCAKTIVKEARSFELAAEEDILSVWRLSGSVVWHAFRATRRVVGHEALENERCVVIKAYRFTVFERFFGGYYHILRVRAVPTCRVYRPSGDFQVRNFRDVFFALL